MSGWGAAPVALPTPEQCAAEPVHLLLGTREDHEILCEKAGRTGEPLPDRVIVNESVDAVTCRECLEWAHA